MEFVVVVAAAAAAAATKDDQRANKPQPPRAKHPGPAQNGSIFDVSRILLRSGGPHWALIASGAHFRPPSGWLRPGQAPGRAVNIGAGRDEPDE